MDAKRRFKVAVLALCADYGLSLGETLTLVKEANHAHMEKQASTAGSVVQGGANLAKIPLSLLLWGGLLGPPLVGAAGGWGLAKATSGINDQTSVEVKHQEMIEELRRQTEHAKAQTEIARHRKERESLRGRSLI